ncbi:hypothetical protein ACM7V2_06735, partial [Pseudomonas aeruginosa]
MQLRHALSSWRSSWPAARTKHALELSYVLRHQCAMALARPLASTTALVDGFHPAVERVDVGLQFVRPWDRGTSSSSLIVTAQPSGAFGHSGINLPAVFFGDIRKLCDLLCLDAGPIPLDDLAQEHFFKSALPRLTCSPISVPRR